MPRAQPRQGVKYVNNEEPAFIKQFKEKIGYKEGPDINSKRNIPNFDEDEEDDGAPEAEEEKPIVVVIKSGDLTAEEADVEQKQIDEGPAKLDEKITFKKPIKRSKETAEASTESTVVDKKQKRGNEKKGAKSLTKRTKNTSLLSFGDEEDEGV
uniref:DUF4604 domain-containing protein n=1 Tax=Arion vulgaris TaxID=1028688 RepID=A0A0B6Y8J8_9EUPU